MSKNNCFILLDFVSPIDSFYVNFLHRPAVGLEGGGGGGRGGGGLGGGGEIKDLGDGGGLDG